MPKYTKHIDALLTIREYEILLTLHGFAVASLTESDPMRWKFLHVTNRVFASQKPAYKRYDIPKEHQWKED